MVRAPRRGIALALAAGACGRIHFASKAQSGGDARATGLDAPSAIIDGPGGTSCLGPPGWTVCMAALPTQPATLPSSITTNATSAACQTGITMAGQPPACFVAATDLAISTSVVADGSEPLVLVATHTITIDATLDVSARHGGATGPGGGNATACAAFVRTPNLDNSGGGGGAGASFMTRGGNGGTGNGNAAMPGTSPAADTSPPATLRPGCRGQEGGDGIGANSHGTGGDGGGAVYLIAGTSITFSGNGAIDASGAAGAFPTTNQYFGGGGGGGTGGMIVLYAPAITVNPGTSLYANGGGGAGGASSSQVGLAGAESVDPILPAAGGTGPGGGGGNGYAAGSSATAGGAGPNNFGGGGGGGGAGYIRANVELGSATVSPPASIVP